jgi:hypothetical protein
MPQVSAVIISVRRLTLGVGQCRGDGDILTPEKRVTAFGEHSQRVGYLG